MTNSECHSAYCNSGRRSGVTAGEPAHEGSRWSGPASKLSLSVSVLLARGEEDFSWIHYVVFGIVGELLVRI